MGLFQSDKLPKQQYDHLLEMLQAGAANEGMSEDMRQIFGSAHALIQERTETNAIIDGLIQMMTVANKLGPCQEQVQWVQDELAKKAVTASPEVSFVLQDLESKLSTWSQEERDSYLTVADLVQWLVTQVWDAEQALGDKTAALTQAQEEVDQANHVLLGEKRITVDQLVQKYNDLADLKQVLVTENNRVGDQLTDLQVGVRALGKTAGLSGQKDLQALIDQLKAVLQRAGNEESANDQAELAQVKAELDQTRSALEQAKEEVDQVNHVQWGDKLITVHQLVEEFNKLAADYNNLRDEKGDLAKKLAGASAELDELRKVVKSLESLTMGGKPVTPAAIIDGYNNLVAKNGQLVAQDKKTTAQLAALQKELSQAQAAEKQTEQALAQLNTKSPLTVKELVTDYQVRVTKNQELDQERQSLQEQATQAQNKVAEQERLISELQTQLMNMKQVPSPAPTEQTSGRTNEEELIDVYYRTVQDVLQEYQDKNAQLQHRLEYYFQDNNSTEFLKLVRMTESATSYQKKLRERNGKMVQYVENHNRQAELVNRNKNNEAKYHGLKGLRYWGNFVFKYNRLLESLLKRQAALGDYRRYALAYGKDQARSIHKQLSFLSSANFHDLKTVGSVLQEKTIYEEMEKFRDEAHATIVGAQGEQLVKGVVANMDADSHVLTSLNLPASYEGQKGTNQIDAVVINQKGIFVLEVKNYSCDEMGIDEKGVIYRVQNGKKYPSGNIYWQGHYHVEAVKAALSQGEFTKKQLDFLMRQVKVVYVSANPNVKLRPAPANRKGNHFVTMDGLLQVFSKAKGSIYPDLVPVCERAILNAQTGEKQYEHVNFPPQPDQRVDAAWHQFEIMGQMGALQIDKLVEDRQPNLMMELKAAGLQPKNGYVTHVARKEKSPK